MFKKLAKYGLSCALLTCVTPCFAWFYAGVEAGYSTVHYTNDRLRGGVTATSITDSGLAPHLHIGYDFNRFIGAEISIVYSKKPLFKGLTDGAPTTKPKDVKIKNNIVYLNAIVHWPLGLGFGVFGQAGGGYVVRDGIRINNTQALLEDEIFTPVYGAGLEYHIFKGWSLTATWIQALGKNSKQLPTTNYFGGGVLYHF